MRNNGNRVARKPVVLARNGKFKTTGEIQEMTTSFGINATISEVSNKVNCFNNGSDKREIFNKDDVNMRDISISTPLFSDANVKSEMNAEYDLVKQQYNIAIEHSYATPKIEKELEKSKFLGIEILKLKLENRQLKQEIFNIKKHDQKSDPEVNVEK